MSAPGSTRQKVGPGAASVAGHLSSRGHPSAALGSLSGAPSEGGAAAVARGGGVGSGGYTHRGGVPATTLGRFHALGSTAVSAAGSTRQAGAPGVHQARTAQGGEEAGVLVGAESDGMIHADSCSGESEDQQGKSLGGGSNPEKERKEKMRAKNEKKHLRQKERKAQELRERCAKALAAHKLLSLVATLEAMGFPHDRCLLALASCDGSLERAVNWILEGNGSGSGEVGTGTGTGGDASPSAGGAGKASMDINATAARMKLGLSDELARMAGLESEMGFTRADIERAVIACEGDLDRAAAQLMEHRRVSHPSPAGTTSLPPSGSSSVSAGRDTSSASGASASSSVAPREGASSIGKPPVLGLSRSLGTALSPHSPGVGYPVGVPGPAQYGATSRAGAGAVPGEGVGRGRGVAPGSPQVVGPRFGNSQVLAYQGGWQGPPHMMYPHHQQQQQHHHHHYHQQHLAQAQAQAHQALPGGPQGPPEAPAQGQAGPPTAPFQPHTGAMLPPASASAPATAPGIIPGPAPPTLRPRQHPQEQGPQPQQQWPAQGPAGHPKGVSGAPMVHHREGQKAQEAGRGAGVPAAHPQGTSAAQAGPSLVSPGAEPEGLSPASSLSGVPQSQVRPRSWARVPGSAAGAPVAGFGGVPGVYGPQWMGPISSLTSQPQHQQHQHQHQPGQVQQRQQQMPIHGREAGQGLGLPPTGPYGGGAAVPLPSQGPMSAGPSLWTPPLGRASSGHGTPHHGHAVVVPGHSSTLARGARTPGTTAHPLQQQQHPLATQQVAQEQQQQGLQGPGSATIPGPRSGALAQPAGPHVGMVTPFAGEPGNSLPGDNNFLSQGGASVGTPWGAPHPFSAAAATQGVPDTSGGAFGSAQSAWGAPLASTLMGLSLGAGAGARAGSSAQDGSSKGAGGDGMGRAGGGASGTGVGAEAPSLASPSAGAVAVAAPGRQAHGMPGVVGGGTPGVPHGPIDGQSDLAGTSSRSSSLRSSPGAVGAPSSTSSRSSTSSGQGGEFLGGSTDVPASASSHDTEPAGAEDGLVEGRGVQIEVLSSGVAPFFSDLGATMGVYDLWGGLASSAAVEPYASVRAGVTGAAGAAAGAHVKTSSDWSAGVSQVPVGEPPAAQRSSGKRVMVGPGLPGPDVNWTTPFGGKDFTSVLHASGPHNGL